MFFFSSVIHVFFQDGTLDTCLEPSLTSLKQVEKAEGGVKGCGKGEGEGM